MSSSRLLNDAMLLLARQPGAVFIGQGVEFDGVAMHASLEGVPKCCRLEFPIAEEMNIGFAVGLAIHGNCLPIVQIPRFDFLLRAADQIVNHLDKIEAMSCGQWVPKLIIRTRVGSKAPLDAGPQHSQNHATAFRMMLTSVTVEEICFSEGIMPTYERAIKRERSTLVVENLRQ